MAEAAAASSLPRRFGRYEVVGHLASGGMAEVLLGRIVGPSGFERPVVLKRILPHLVRRANFRAMFLDEARIVAGIHHPNVVAVHELGTDGGELFLVLEYLEGESAAGIMRRLALRDEWLDPSVAAHIVASACAGLHAAHELADEEGVKRNLVHRDVSPQNLVVTYEGDVKVLDFGIALTNDRTARTEAGQIKGKYEYMSPEQCLGKPLDRRSDIFALGIVLYELSTGRRLFRRENELFTIQAICNEPIPPPSSLSPGYPRELEGICAKALARRPEERFATATEMRRALLDARDALERRSSAPGRLPEEALATLMKRLFSDRIEEKREMLRRVRAGSTVTHVPAAEVDTLVELPGATRADVTRTEAALGGDALRRRPRARLPWVVAGGLGAALALAVVLASTPRVDEPSTPESSASQPASSPRPDEVLLHVESSPPSAEVLLDGRPRGATPLDLRVARAEHAVAIEVRREGFETVRQHLVMNVDQRVILTLSPVTSAAPHPPVRPRPAASARAAKGFYRFD